MAQPKIKGKSTLQGVPTSLGYAKYNVLKLRKVCERSELRLQNIDPIKRALASLQFYFTLFPRPARANFFDDNFEKVFYQKLFVGVLW